MHLPALLTTLATTTTAIHTLYATHYSGQVYTLHLGDAGNANHSASLSIAATATTCGAMPSWLTVDHDAGVLYCTDENEAGGSLTVLAPASGDGRLREVAKTADVGGGVNSVVYGGSTGKYLAVAH